ncbi:MAG TPA: hypothetical protein DCO71_08655 [Gammaproteobacteria bacterium]|nr:hypothetical protein [Gammaproteobacteria bacterium]
MQENTLLAKRELQYLFVGVIFLVVANIIDLVSGTPFWGITRFIYLGSDENVSAWYSSILLAVAGLIAYECWLYANKKNIQGSLSFLLFAGLLVFMSADEVARIHEIIGRYTADFFGISSRDFATRASWVWIGGPFVIAVFIGFMLLLRKMFSLVPGSMFYLLTGFSLIILGGVILESTINFLNHEELQWLWNIEIIVEESLEMIGTLFIAYALIVWRDGAIKLYP